MLDDFTCYVELVQDNIFACKFKEANKIFMEKLDILALLASQVPESALAEYNNIMLEIFSAQQKNDYLLIADLLEYKMKVFARKHLSASLQEV